MRTRSATIALLAVLVLTGCVAPLQSNDSGATGDTNSSTVAVSANGQASAEADLAVLFLSVTARGETAETARSRVAEDVNRMQQALEEAGVNDSDVTTTDFSIRPLYARNDSESRLVGYLSVHAFRIQTTPDRAGATVDLAIGSGADEVEGIQFTVTNRTRTRLRQRALERAMTAARSDADTVARAANRTIAEVAEITTSDWSGPLSGTRFEAVADNGTTFDPGPVTVRATVSVVYRLGPSSE